MGTYRAPDVDMRRYWWLGVRVPLEVDVIPPQRTRSSVRTPTRRLRT